MIHGKYSTYSNHRCHCPECKRAWTEYNAKLRARRRNEPIPASTPHGKASTYSNWGCQCRPCKDAHNAENRASRARRKAAQLAAALLES